MKSFELYDATTVQEAVKLLDEYGPAAKVVAGGSDLVSGIMKDWIQGSGMPYPEKLIDITTIPELKGIRLSATGASIGAVTALTDIVESQEVKSGWPVFWKATHSVASPLIRNEGTLGGNINQRPRCWYFRGTQFSDCYKRGGDFCFAVTGDNRYHSIIEGELCYIVHPSDTAIALVALNAAAKIAGPSGERVVSFDDYFIGPRQDVLRETILAHNEILVEVQIPPLAPNTKTAWIKLRDRQSFDFATVSVAAVVTSQDGVWQDGRIVVGGVSPTPYRAKTVEEALVGKNIKDAIRDAAARIRNVARPMSENKYKVKLATGLIERAVLAALT